LESVAHLVTPAQGLHPEQAIGFLPHRGRRIAYAVSGAGPPLLLDVGRPHHLEAFWRYAPYRHLVQRLSRRFTVVRWDRPGIGLSDRQALDLSPEAELALVERLVMFLAGDDVAILAAGDAGPGMVRFAARRPERVSRLALFGTAAAGHLLMPGPDEALALLTGASAAAIHDVVAAAQAAGCEPEVSSWLASALEASADVPTMVQLVAAAGEIDARQDAAFVRTPTLVLHRSGDAVVDPQAARTLASSIPGAEFAALDGRSHLIYAGDIAAMLGSLIPFLAGGGEVPAPLSDRELEVAEMVTLGLSNAEIGTRLVIRRRTVEAHLEHIRTKLGVSSRAQIAVWFTRSSRAGIVPREA
jgi:DNA-binding CsgD family transcriptional regulator/pimeloyl-ACP methyl ester carboxylesterase